jgi:phage terminase large subunit-like protein
LNSSAAVLDRPAKGAQEPRFLSLPLATDEDFGDRAVALADLAGLNLDPWQQLALRSMLRRDATGHFVAFESCLLVPRQCGKSVVLEAFDLAKLYLSPPGTLILHTAHLFPTAVESFRHLLGLVKNTPELWDEVEKVRNAHGEEGIELKNGSRLRFAARTVTGAGRGFSPDVVILDEAFKLPHEALSALMPALSAKPNPQIAYASSTGYPDSEILWSLVERGRRGGDPTLAYLEWSAEPDCDLDDREAWAQANPALGFRLTERKIAAERASMRDDDFGRERLGLWAEAGASGVFVPGSWESCTDPASQIVATPAFGVDVSVDRRTASLGVCGGREDSVLHLETVQNRSGTEWIVPELTRITAENGGFVVIDPASPAGSVIEDLKAAGVRVYTVTAREYAQACGWLYDAVKGAEIRHLGQAELDSSVHDARMRDLAGGFAWDRRKPLSDITPLVAVTLACWGSRTYGGDLAGAVW